MSLIGEIKGSIRAALLGFEKLSEAFFNEPNLNDFKSILLLKCSLFGNVWISLDYDDENSAG